ncbi:phage tail tape measure protein, partial [Croceibacter atlanticus]|uniref:phage tail tape measure protein n=1 Tax=Croceibacter atlanticus TaxID=313588 RepID=UPI0030D700F8
ALTNIFNGAINGDIDQISTGFNTLGNNIKGAGKALLGFALTPVGAIASLIALVAGAIKVFVDYNESIKEQVLLTDQLTKLQGEQADQTRLLAATIQETYGKDFKETLTTAKVLVNEFKVDYQTALEIIDQGLLEGGQRNEEYFDSLTEYATFFNQAGFSVTEFKNIINSGYDLSIYQDKLPDAIKEFSIAVQEQTPAAREALENAFGTSFTDSLLKGIETGTLSVKDALQQVAEESQKQNISIQQQAQLTADLFKGAGEDAGGALKIFEAVTNAYKDQNRALTPLEENLKRVRDANLELAKAQDEALKGDGYVALSNNVSVFWTKVKTEFFKGVTFITDKFNSLLQFSTKTLAQLIASITAIPAVTSATFTAIKKEGLEVIKTFGLLGDVFENLKNFEFSKAAESANKFTTAFKKEITDVGDVASNSINLIAEISEEAGRRVDENFNRAKEGALAQQKAEQDALNALANNAGSGNNTENEDDSTTKEIDDSAFEARKTAYLEFDEFIKRQQEARLVSQKEGLQKELTLIDQKYAAELEKYKEFDDIRAELEQQRDQEKADAKLALQKDYQERTNALEEENRIAKEEMEFERELANVEDTQLKEELRLQRAQELALRELEMAKEAELAKVEAVEGSEELKAAITEKYRIAGSNITKEFDDEEKEIRKNQVDWTKLTEEQKLNTITGALSNAAMAFNEGSAAYKAIKISETLITTYQSAQSAYGALAGIPVVGPALGAAAAGLAVISGLKQVQQIKNTPVAKAKAPKKRGLFEGGPTGNDAIGYDADGKITNYVHEDEYVIPRIMTQDPKFANTIGWLEQNRQQHYKGHFTGGTVGNIGGLPNTAQDPINSNTDLGSTLNRLANLIENPVQPNLIIGYEDDERLEQLRRDREQSQRNTTIAS